MTLKHFSILVNTFLKPLPQLPPKKSSPSKKKGLKIFQRTTYFSRRPCFFEPPKTGDTAFQPPTTSGRGLATGLRSVGGCWGWIEQQVVGVWSSGALGWLFFLGHVGDERLPAVVYWDNFISYEISNRNQDFMGCHEGCDCWGFGDYTNPCRFFYTGGLPI